MSSPLETDIYDDLYGDEGDTKTEEPTSQQTAEKPTNLPTPPIQAVKEEASEVKPLTGENSLPAKPTQSAELSYSAQIAQQFSAYKQTPAQERQQRTFPPAASKSSPGEPKSPEEAIEESSLRRQVRPSEMKDEG
ncbi:hypothetical protein CERSUDRAFT_96980 [Gelatoporia subvermispora B]|uniref:Uncharacterized protein n=1 Tax=Ceriporiopsis subvermispora (strain B) TaxID=914234 RepID=M2QSP9_CERS8|nr:hypothetical protein CERSUDRAFT_96980 [Gelatoporia subvermispora B]